MAVLVLVSAGVPVTILGTLSAALLVQSVLLQKSCPTLAPHLHRLPQTHVITQHAATACTHNPYTHTASNNTYCIRGVLHPTWRILHSTALARPPTPLLLGVLATGYHAETALSGACMHACPVATPHLLRIC